jgi:hypothetical protein
MSDDRSRPGSVYLSERDWLWLRANFKREGYRSVSAYVAGLVRMRRRWVGKHQNRLRADDAT